MAANDNWLMIYFQGMKVYIPDNFQPDTLLKLLQILKKLVSALNIDVGIIAGTLLVYTTLCFEALTFFVEKNVI